MEMSKTSVKMFTCLPSSKKKTSKRREADHNNDDTPRANTKTLSAQIKDMALKVSNSFHIKPRTRSSSHISEGVQYPYMADVSASPTPHLDYGGFAHLGRSSETRHIGGSIQATSSRGELSDFQAPRHEASSISEIKEEDQVKSSEWMAEVEEGVNITFVSLPNGGNELRKLRFNREMFNQWQAQKWWDENRDKIVELYNIQRINRQDLNIAPTPTEHEIVEQPREASYPTLADTRDSRMSMSFRDWVQGGSSS
ncbi:hypothetical protein RIF29_18927 [Crotalaria pallida]|uniref:BRX domain-containing protein n=1 Tax=Crotalaria pallida TaxID=3830 RepID=A0AAN9F0C1_CROPI